MEGHCRIRAFWIILWILAALVMGCATPKSPAPPHGSRIAIQGEAARLINRDINGEPNSVVVRVYFLRSPVEFHRLTFDMATGDRSDAELLGQDFLGKSEFVLVPGATLTQPIDLPGGTAYLGLVALFRKPDPNYWRYLVEVTPLVRSGSDRLALGNEKLPLLSFKAEECFLAMRNVKPVFIPGQPEGVKPVCLGNPALAPARTPPRTLPPPSSPKAPKPAP